MSPFSQKLRQVWLPALEPIGALLCCFVLLNWIGLPVYRSLGNSDFIEYWAAYRVWQSGQNPFDASLVFAVQRAAGYPHAAPLMMWNPPWLLLLLSPILLFSYASSAKIFWTLSLLLLIGMAVFCWRLLKVTEDRARPLWYLMLFLFPIYFSLCLGQIGIILLLGTVLVFWGLSREKSPPFAAGIVLWSLKPHLFYLLFVALGWWIVKCKKWDFLLAASLLLVGFAGATELWRPGSIGWWIAAVSSRPAHAPATFDWMPATLVGGLNQALSVFTGSAWRWPAAVIPGFSAVMLYAIMMRAGSGFSWGLWFPPLLSLSLFTSPFGWIFDNSVLLVTHLHAMWLLERSGTKIIKVGLIAALLVIQIILFVLLRCCFQYHHQLFWFSLLPLVYWLFCYRLSPSEEQIAEEP